MLVGRETLLKLLRHLLAHAAASPLSSAETAQRGLGLAATGNPQSATTEREAAILVFRSRISERSDRYVIVAG